MTKFFGLRISLARAFQFAVMLTLLAALLMPAPTPVQAALEPVPTFDVISITPDVSIRIRTYNVPAGRMFTVRMGTYGTLGIGGEVVGNTNSGAGGSYEETYTIPASLAGSYRIAVRMESDDGYYAYNWFYNNESSTTPTTGGTGGPVTPGYTGIPTFSIPTVVTDSTITIQTSNFPANQEFTVRMGAYGTLGIGGTVVGTTNSGAGGSITATYSIPDALKGAAQIAVRMDSPAGYYAYNWFYNNSTSGGTGGPVTPGTGGPVYTGIPTFNVTNINTDTDVTIQTSNFPANQDFTVRMGAYGTLGIGGTVVTTTNSGAGGSFNATYSIPADLKGASMIAIRLESASGYYAYNWFYNNTTTNGGTGGPVATPVPGTGGPVYTGIPTFSISSVTAGNSVTVQAYNFPAGQDFTVRMGAYGTLAVGGEVVGTTNTGAGGNFTATYTIPASLAGNEQIAIRMDAAAGYYAYNWFWNY